MSDNHEIEYGPLESGCQEELFSFYRRHLERGDRTVELYQWRLADEAASGGARTCVARLDGAIVGTLNAIPFELAVGGSTVRATWQQDTVVDAAMRGRGVGKRLVEVAGEGWDVIMAKGTSPAMYGLRRSVGFVDVPSSNYLKLVLSPAASGPASGKRLLDFALYGASLLRSGFGLRRSRGGAASARQVRAVGPELEAIRGSAAESSEVRVVKDRAYLNWRYFTCPRREYRVMRIDRGGSRCGAVILDGPRDHDRSAWIVDMVVDPWDRSATADVIGAAVAECRALGASTINAFATAPIVRQGLFRAGFFGTSSTPQFTYRAASLELADELGKMNWSFWHGDGDVELYR